jgi:hypothetical protein
MSQDELSAVQRGYNTREELEDLKVLPPEDKVKEKRICII